MINIDLMISKVMDALSTKTVIGEPMTFGEVTLIPIMNVSFGFGGGGGDGKVAGNDQGSGGGGGGGARLNVAGMVVVKGDEVSFVPTGKSSGRGGSIDRVLETLPELVETLKGKGEKTPSAD